MGVGVGNSHVLFWGIDFVAVKEGRLRTDMFQGRADTDEQMTSRGLYSPWSPSPSISLLGGGGCGGRGCSAHLLSSAEGSGLNEGGGVELGTLKPYIIGTG